MAVRGFPTTAFFLGLSTAPCCARWAGGGLWGGSARGTIAGEAGVGGGEDFSVAPGLQAASGA